MRYYGFCNSKGEVVITDVFREDSYNLKYEEDLKEFVEDINQLYSNYGKLYGFEKELIDSINSLKELDDKFKEDSISCFGMIRSTLISIYQKLYGEYEV